MSSAISLRSLLISFNGGQVVLPSSTVVEVLTFATPLHIENAPHWVVGATLWRNLTTPLVSLAQLIYQIPADNDQNGKIAIINALGSDSKLPHFGLLCTQMPRPIELTRENITPDNRVEPSQQTLPGVLSWVRVNNQPALIPDLDAIEAVLKPLVRRA